MTCTYIAGRLTVKPVDESIRIERWNESQKIISTIADFYGVSIEDIKKKGRKAPLPWVRMISSYFIYTRLTMTLSDIADQFGDSYSILNGKRDHSAIVHNVNTVKGFIKVGDPVCQDIQYLETIL